MANEATDTAWTTADRTVLIQPLGNGGRADAVGFGGIWFSGKVCQNEVGRTSNLVEVAEVRERGRQPKNRWTPTIPLEYTRDFQVDCASDPALGAERLLERASQEVACSPELRPALVHLE